MNVPIAFDIHMYYDFIEFWNEHDPDLVNGFHAVCWCCLPPRKLGDGPRLLNPKGDRALVAAAVGEADADRLLHGREELLDDEAFRCRVGLRMWEVADAEPHNDEQSHTYKYRHHPRSADLWQAQTPEAAAASGALRPPGCRAACHGPGHRHARTAAGYRPLRPAPAARQHRLAAHPAQP